jgi:AhpC/TSA family
VELQSRVKELAQQGLGLAVITYDAPEILKRFSDERGITFPLLSDQGSAIIKRYGLLNTTVQPGTRAEGIPLPGTFVLDKTGRVVARYIEEAYQERNTVSSILARQGNGIGSGPSVSASTAHLEIKRAAADAAVAPGSRTTLVFDITPRPGIHVYAPGKHTYQVVRVVLDPQPWLRVHQVQYPQSEIYHFKPLDVRVEVYQKPFRLTQDVTVLATLDAQKRLASTAQVTGHVLIVKAE